MLTEWVWRVTAIGVGATAVMDLWLMLLRALGVPTLNFALLGRWIGHLRNRRWFHAGMVRSEPIRRELLVGWLAHYAIGIGFAGLLVMATGIAWIEQPTFEPALVFGIATAAVPLFVMQPAMGSGMFFSKTPAPLRNSLKSIVGHAVFGCGLYVAASVLALAG